LGARDSQLYGWDYYFDGTLAEVQLWNCARTATDIRSDMFRCLEGTETGLIGYWPLTEGSGTTVTDRSDAGQDGICSAAPHWHTDAYTVKRMPASRTPQFQGAWPFTMADFDTGNTRVTDSNVARIASFPIPDGYDVYQLGEGEKSTSVDPLSWTSTGAAPDRVSFSKPADGATACSYVWFTNTAASVALRRAAAVIVCASNEPALAFNAASNSYVAMATGLYPELTNLTLSAWIKTDTRPASGSYGAIAGRGYLGNMNGFGLFLCGDDDKVYIQTRTGGTTVTAGTAYPFDGAWHHVAGVRDGDTTRLYLDGVLAAEATGSLSSLYSPGIAFGLGARQEGGNGWVNKGFYFTGSMRDVRLYNYARSSREIKSDRSYYLKGTETGLIGYWPLDEGVDDTVFDGTETNDNPGTGFDTFWEYTVDFMRQRPPPGLLIRLF